MSERGKYFDPEKYGISPVEKPPVSVGNPRVNPHVKTLEAEQNNTEDPVVQENIKDVQNDWRRTKLLSVAWISMVLGAGGTGIYMWKTQQGPFAPKESSVETAPTVTTNQEDRYEVPLEIKTDKDLQKALEQQGIKAKPEDFEFDPGRSALHAKVLRLTLIAGNDRLGVKPSYIWQPVLPAERGKPNIERDIERSQLLVAVQFINPYAQRLMDKVVNPGPSAHKYIAHVADPDDPNIVYFYFDRCINREQEHALARIRIQHPENPQKHVWYQSFDIPKCQNDANSVESDAPIQE